MVLGQNLIAWLDILAAHQQLQGHLPKDDLFFGAGPTETRLGFVHDRKPKTILPRCSAKSGNRLQS
jgi:hypothetical protein